MLHRCDNPPCVNPGHLFVGTKADNSADMVRKERSATGERHGLHKHPERRPRGDRHGMHLHPEAVTRGEAQPNSRLTDESVRWIRSRPLPVVEMAKTLGVNWSLVYKVLRREIWKHVA